MQNKKAMTYTVNIMLRLLVICLVVAALTALVYAVTKAPIAAGERARKEAAIRTIFPEADTFTEDYSVTGAGFNAVYAVTDANEAPLGWCVDYTGTSDYGGDVNMMVGVSAARRVIGVQIISHSETFIDRYLDDDNRYTGVDTERGDDLSAGATMSYNAIRNAIEAVEAAFARVEGDTAPTPTVVAEADVKLLFPAATAWSVVRESTDAKMGDVYAVRGADGTLLGYLMPYAATGGYSGGAEMLVSICVDGRVADVLVLDFADDRMDQYLDAQGRYNGSDAMGQASRSYQMIRSAINAAQALELGGAL